MITFLTVVVSSREIIGIQQTPGDDLPGPRSRVGYFNVDRDQFRTVFAVRDSIYFRNPSTTVISHRRYTPQEKIDRGIGRN